MTKRVKILYPVHNEALRFQVQSSRPVPNIAALILLEETLA